MSIKNYMWASTTHLYIDFKEYVTLQIWNFHDKCTRTEIKSIFLAYIRILDKRLKLVEIKMKSNL